jgi:hypothetical protein
MLQRFTLSIAGETQIARGFDVLAADARDLREPLGETHDYLRGVIGEQFESEGAHGGSRWQDLSSGYAEQKAEKYGDGLPILVASGDMRAAWLARQPLEMTSHRLVMGPSEGSEEEMKSAAAQVGTSRAPQRRIVNLTTGDKRGIDRIFAEFFSARTRKLVGSR